MSKEDHSNAKFYLKGHARKDVIQIRKYTIKTWGNAQWEVYKQSLLQNFQQLANNPEIGIKIDNISAHAFRFPLRDHVIYYLRRQNDIIIVGVISNNMSPSEHLQRKHAINNID